MRMLGMSARALSTQSRAVGSTLYSFLGSLACCVTMQLGLYPSRGHQAPVTASSQIEWPGNVPWVCP